MKVTFWKHKFQLVVFLTVFMPIVLALFIAGLVMIILDVENFWPLFLAGIVSLLGSIFMLFEEKRMPSKVIFSEVGIVWLFLRKTVTYIEWTEITEITTKIRGRGVRDLSFIAGDKRIDVTLTKKMYDAIMIICPEPNIKMDIKELKEKYMLIWKMGRLNKDN